MNIMGECSNCDSLRKLVERLQARLKLAEYVVTIGNELYGKIHPDYASSQRVGQKLKDALAAYEAGRTLQCDQGARRPPGPEREDAEGAERDSPEGAGRTLLRPSGEVSCGSGPLPPTRRASREAGKRIEMNSDSMRYLQRYISGWQRLQFGEGRALPAAHHLREEVDELIADLEKDAPGVAEEVADCALLVFAVADHLGIDLFEAIIAKMQTNISRKWGQPDDNGVIRHIRAEKPEGGSDAKARMP